MFKQAFKDSFSFSMPIQGTDVAGQWDSLYHFLLWLSIFFFLLIVGGMIYFIIVYRHKKQKETAYITDHHVLEAVWIAIPTFLLLVLFAWGFSVYRSMTHSPTDAYEIRVIGKQWLWTFLYDDGRTTVNEVFVPANRPVKLVMTSEDVLHGFFVPNFRIKQDVVPGMYTSIWFKATVPGRHTVFCTEYCGTSHSSMLAHVVVLDEEDWTKWTYGKKVNGGPNLTFLGQPQILPNASHEEASDFKKTDVQLTLVEQGRIVYQKKGCLACHSTDGRNGIGPTHKGLYGSQVELADGRTITADENYIRNHIENPNTGIVKGYSPVMPTFKGLIDETEMNALIAYIKSLK